jgi:hypothetical protein
MESLRIRREPQYLLYYGSQAEGEEKSLFEALWPAAAATSPSLLQQSESIRAFCELAPQKRI